MGYPNRELTEQVIGFAIKVHRGLGPGLLESVYEECLCHELAGAQIPFQRQHPIPVIYNSIRMECGFRADLIVFCSGACRNQVRRSIRPDSRSPAVDVSSLGRNEDRASIKLQYRTPR
jgi:hypothetical protein